jgi:hypothetical protein
MIVKTYHQKNVVVKMLEYASGGDERNLILQLLLTSAFACLREFYILLAAQPFHVCIEAEKLVELIGTIRFVYFSDCIMLRRFELGLARDSSSAFFALLVLQACGPAD